MRIEKSVTPHFSQYEVYTKELRNLPQTWWQWLRRIQPTAEIDVRIEGVIEADDSSGLLVQQVKDANGNLVFTNTVEDIVLDNTARLLLMIEPLRQTFLAQGFRPKLVRTYKETLSIKYRGPIQPDKIIVIEKALAED